MNNVTVQIKSFKILLVEDEEKIRKHLAKSLLYFVDEVVECSDGKDALSKLENFTPDIIITDIEMPVMNGIDFIKNVRIDNKNVLIVVLTAFDTPEYLRKLIDMHLEHYVIKPVDFEKLISILHNCEKQLSMTKTVVKELPGGFIYDENQKKVFLNDEPIHLTKKEILFIELLIKNNSRVVRYEEFENYVWEDSVMTDNALKSLVRNLRKKLSINLVENLSGIGYKLV